MKYQNLSAFEKHLHQASKVHISRIFLVISPCPYERKKIVEKIIAAIRVKESELSIRIEEAQQSSLEEMIDELNTASLFSGQQLLYLDEIDQLKKAGLTLLAKYAAHPSPFAYLLLGSNTAKGLDDLSNQAKKELIVCDLSNEKPWDRKDRLKKSLIAKAAKAGKRFPPDAAEALLDNVGLDLPYLEQEVDKLITFAGDRQEMDLSDVQALSAAQKSENLWQLAEAMVWKESHPRLDEAIDLSLLLPLISGMRTQLQHGLMLATLMERGANQTEIAHYLPAVKPAALGRMLPIAKARKSVYFRRALDILFDIELLVKNSAFEPALIFDLISAKFTLLKNALPAAQPTR